MYIYHVTNQNDMHHMKRCNKHILKRKSSICFILLLWVGIILQAQEAHNQKDTFKILTKQYNIKQIYPKGTGASYFIFEDKLQIKTRTSSKVNFSEAPSSMQYINPVLANQQPVPFLKKQPPLKTKRKTIEK